MLTQQPASRTHHKSPLLLGGLEASVAKFGGGVDEFELDGPSGLARCVLQQRLWGRAVTR